MASGSADGTPRQPELDVVLCCARVRLDDCGAARLQELLRGDLDWTRVLEMAYRHRVLPVVARQLQALPSESIPAEVQEFLRFSREGTGMRNLLSASQLIEIVNRLEGEGIPAIPYKGPALAVLAYGALGLREYLDLDILVRQRDVGRVWDLLASLGYRPNPEGTAAPSASPDQVPGQYSFWRSARDCLVEVHTERTLRYFPAPPELDRFRDRLEPVALGGRAIRTFSAEDMLAFLCVHGSKHFWDRLLWICDVAELAQLPRGLDWDRAIRNARELGCERMVQLGLYLANRILGAPIPEGILRRAETNREIDWLARVVARGLFGETRMGIARRFQFRLRMAGGRWQGWQYGLRLATTPTTEDWEASRLPRPLAPIAAVLRPMRLFLRYGPRAVRTPEPDLAPYVPTPPGLVEKMLALAEVKPSDVLYDIGCGDGRIVIAAAKQHGVRAVGVDIDPGRIEEARAAARREGVGDRVRFFCGDAKTLDFSEASVVTLYLTLYGNLRLEEALREQLHPGARIVSRDFAMPGWPAEKSEAYEDGTWASGVLFLWRIRSGSKEIAAEAPQESRKRAMAAKP